MKQQFLAFRFINNIIIYQLIILQYILFLINYLFKYKYYQRMPKRLILIIKNTSFDILIKSIIAILSKLFLYYFNNFNPSFIL